MAGEASTITARPWLPEAGDKGRVVRWARHRRNKVLEFATVCRERGDIGAEHFEQIRAAIDQAERAAS